MEDSPKAEETLSAEALEDSEELVENEPYLGPAWAVAMFILYLLKEAFPAEQYSLLWWFQSYIILLVVAITIFTLVKRHQFYKENEDLLQKEKMEPVEKSDLE